MIVVSDTSCISNLLTIGQSSLLSQLFGQVIIPPAVENELLRFHKSLPEYIRIVAPCNTERVLRLQHEIDPGEAEAICVASELRADRLLIDDAIGRAVAVREGIPIVGLVGILIIAKNKLLIAAVKPVLEQLESQAGFRLSQALKLEALRAAGEAP